MYKFRSRAVHGVALDKSLMEKQVCDSRALLSSLLCRMIDLGHIPSEDEWDVVLLGEDHRRTSAST